MAKLIKANDVEGECDLMVVRKGFTGGPDSLYRAAKMTKNSVILGFWYNLSERGWVAYPPEGREPLSHMDKVIARKDILCVVESVEEFEELRREWRKYRLEMMSLLERHKAEIASITSPINARYEAEYSEMKKAHKDRLNRLLGVKVF